MPFNKSVYDQQYAKEHITRKFLSFNRDDQDDVAMLMWLKSKGRGNMNEYVKKLIREDMIRAKNTEKKADS